jgi:hypothetical protein
MLTFARMDLLARTIVFLWALCVLCALAVVFKDAIAKAQNVNE